MPIDVEIRGLEGSPEAQRAQEEGVLDSEQVMVQFVCQTEDGGHNPEAAPDERVRPHHAALHGTFWRIDDPAAPVPPLDFGCRCAIRYVAKPGTIAARVLDPVSDAPAEVSPKRAQTAWLDANVPRWQEVAKVASEATPQERLNLAYLKAKQLGISSPRDVARMAAEASPFPARPAGPLGTGPLSGVGASGRRLVEAWRTGDLQAAAKLARSYPATYARLLAEEPALRPIGGSPPPPAPVPPAAPPPAPIAPLRAPGRPQEADAIIARMERLGGAFERLEAQVLARQEAAKAKLGAARDLAAMTPAELADFEDTAVEAAKAHQDRAALIKRAQAAMRRQVAVERPSKVQVTIGSKVDAPRMKRWTDGIAGFRSLVAEGLIDDVEIEVRAARSGRSFNRAGNVHMSKHAGTEVVVHEMAHTLEKRAPGILAKAIAFRARRTAGNPLRKLSDLVHHAGYRRDEVAREGGFPDAYVGKEYPGDRATEVISMGLELLYKQPLTFARQDPDYFRFIFDVVRGR